MIDLAADLELIRAAAIAAGDLALAERDRGIKIWSKSGGSPVTSADLAVDALLKDMLLTARPDYGWLSEETADSSERLSRERIFIVDPIDGTRAFISGLPLWTTLIGLRVAGRPSVGAISQPYIGELFLGGPSGAVLMSRGQTKPIKTRACERLTDAVISTTDPEIFTGSELGAWTQVRAAARLARYGCDAYAYAMVAAGRMDLVAETSLKLWDWSALIPVVEAAGGEVTNWRGEAVDGTGQILAVGDVRIREQALVTLKRAAL